MSFSRKVRKLKRDPVAFFKDSKVVKFFYKKSGLVKNVSPLEPALYGKITGNINNINIKFYDKKVINQQLGFSTLIMLEENNSLLKHIPFVSYILQEKKFIAFREKSIYFIRESKSFRNIFLTENDIFCLFKKYPKLHNNSLNQFRTLIIFNPLTPWGFILKKSNPNLKLILIVDSEESLNFIKRYSVDDIDGLIYNNRLKIEFLKEIFRYEEFEDKVYVKLMKIRWENRRVDLNLKDYQQQYKNYHFTIKYQTLVKILQALLIDFSFKREQNLLLPIVCKTSNMIDIDLLNENREIDGLIKFKNQKSFDFDTFDKLIQNIEIEELFLRENIFNTYKSFILGNKMDGNNLKILLKRALKDGAFFYEKE